MLPIGQRETAKLERFGLPQFKERFPPRDADMDVPMHLPDGTIAQFAALSAQLPKTRITTDFHCVTGWSVRQLDWEGWRFSDVLAAIDQQQSLQVKFVEWRGHDGFRAILPIQDACAENLLLATHLQGAPLGLANGAPLRLVAPAHYGYKSVKHLKSIHLLLSDADFQAPSPGLFVHPRARVAKEERGNFLPQILFRYLFRYRVKGTTRDFAKALAKHQETEEV